MCMCMPRTDTRHVIAHEARVRRDLLVAMLKHIGQQVPGGKMQAFGVLPDAGRDRLGEDPPPAVSATLGAGGCARPCGTMRCVVLPLRVSEHGVPGMPVRGMHDSSINTQVPHTAHAHGWPAVPANRAAYR